MNTYRWSNEQLRSHTDVLDGKIAPHLLLKNATYINNYVHDWVKANIWIYEDRIVYVGDNLPVNEPYETVDCEGQYIVPGYIEPHVHPAQLYNPITFAQHAAQFGTTTLISDNLAFFTELSTAKALGFLDECNNLTSSMYWWCRFDAQTELPNNAALFTNEAIHAWLKHPSVLQGGEVTAWPKVVAGDDQILSWMQETKRLHKRIEGHFPGASERTLAKLKLLGADCDHEAMTGQEALNRLQQGYYVSLRQSSIRPDLDVLLKELIALDVTKFDRFFMTTDGSHPYFYEDGVTDKLIKKAIHHGVPVMAAYQMASYNIATYYNVEHLHGSIATGRIANLNILENQLNPTPVSVLAKGQWVKRDGQAQPENTFFNWDQYGFAPLPFAWELSEEDLQFTNNCGMHLINNVIAKPYETTLDLQQNTLDLDHDECFLMMIARDGSWRINTIVKGFANKLSGFASSYSGPGDILLIGKSKQDMLLAFERMKTIGGGIVLAENGEILHEISLPLLGRMSNLALPTLISLEKKMIALLQARGYQYDDPAFTLYFFSATHLPFIRLTPCGLVGVKKNEVLVPPTKRYNISR